MQQYTNIYSFYKNDDPQSGLLNLQHTIITRLYNKKLNITY